MSVTNFNSSAIDAPQGGQSSLQSSFQQGGEIEALDANSAEILQSVEFKKWIFMRFRANATKSPNTAYGILTTNKSLDDLNKEYKWKGALRTAMYRVFTEKLGVDEGLVGDGRASYQDDNRNAVRVLLVTQFILKKERKLDMHNVIPNEDETSVLPAREQEELFLSIQKLRTEVCRAAKIEDYEYACLKEIIESRDKKDKKGKFLYSPETVNKVIELQNLYARAMFHNVRIAYRYAQFYPTMNGIEEDDYVQEGRVALIKSIDKFDANHGVVFGTYAVRLVRQAMRKFLQDHKTNVQIGRGTQEAAYVVDCARSELMAQGINNPSLEQLSAHTGFGTKRLSNASNVPAQTSMTIQSKGQQGTSIRKIQDQSAQTPFQIVAGREYEEANGVLKRISDFLSLLNAQELSVVSRLYGLNDNAESTLKEIGAEMGLTKERVRQIQVKAFTKLYTMFSDMPEFSEWLDGYFDASEKEQLILAKFFLMYDSDIPELRREFSDQDVPKSLDTIFQRNINIQNELSTIHRKSKGYSAAKRFNIKKAVVGRFLNETGLFPNIPLFSIEAQDESHMDDYRPEML